MTDADAIRDTIARYCHLCDDGRFDAFAELFTTDAELRVMGKVHAGRDAIRTFMAEAQPPERRGKHVTSNTVIEVDDDAPVARAWTDYVFVAPQRDGSFGIISVGRYHDELVADHGRWRFRVREIVFLADGVPAGH